MELGQPSVSRRLSCQLTGAGHGGGDQGQNGEDGELHLGSDLELKKKQDFEK